MRTFWLLELRCQRVAGGCVQYLTFDMRGGRKQAKLHCGRPLDGRVRPHVRSRSGARCGDDNRRRRPSCWPMENGLNVVSVWVEGERSVVARVVTALAGRTIVATTCAKRCPMKCLDGRAIQCLKGEMNPRHMPFC